MFRASIVKNNARNKKKQKKVEFLRGICERCLVTWEDKERKRTQNDEWDKGRGREREKY